MDVTFITANNSKKIYQDLAKTHSAIEPPTWSLLLAQSCRSRGYKCSIIDAIAENLSIEETYLKIKLLNPKLVVFTVYGQNVNAGTTSMSGSIALANYLKEKKYDKPLVFIGSHVQALPIETVNKEKSIDIACTNEGVYTLHSLLKTNDYSEKNLESINGICFRKNGQATLTLPEKIVPQEKMDIDLPGYAFDLLPFREKPFDLYRAPMWHAEYDDEKRTPYAAIQTSLGCMFGCDFCMINIINRDDNEEIGVASRYSKMRYWSTGFIINEFKKLIEDYGVKTIRIIDEMFLLNPKYYKPLCEELGKLNLNDQLRLWAYSRVDTVKHKEILNLVRRAGIKWLCLGIESGEKKIRLEISKGKFEEVDIKKVVEHVHDADIDIMANYIYGLPGDTLSTMKATLNLSKELCTLGWNTYTAMPLPGSKLYKDAISQGQKLPETYEGYSFHSYDTHPLPTKNLSPREILEFRDNAFTEYHLDKNFLAKLESKFGIKAVNNVKEMTKIKLRRKLLEATS
tara:strand:+ start:3870 stop:5408 length:1539 start_codon:yes stop_codon:yes gene_type:complete